MRAQERVDQNHNRQGFSPDSQHPGIIGENLQEKAGEEEKSDPDQSREKTAGGGPFV